MDCCVEDLKGRNHYTTWWQPCQQILVYRIYRAGILAKLLDIVAIITILLYNVHRCRVNLNRAILADLQ
jgi:hypothetical protein